MKRKVFVVLCTVALVTSAFVVIRGEAMSEVLKTRFLGATRYVPASAQKPSPNRAADETAPRSVPAHAVFNEFFYHVSFLKKQAEKEEKAGKDAAALRSFYKRQAKLDDAQQRHLDQTASKLARELERMDEKAQKLIKQFRAEVQAMHIAPGQMPPAPPEELKAMQAERNASVLRSRDELRDALGEEAFGRLDRYVQQNIATRMMAERFDRPRPENPNRPR